MLLTKYDPNRQVSQKNNQELLYLLNQFTHANMMLYDIFINYSCVINVAYFYMLFLPKVNIYFAKYFLIDARLADFLHYDVAKWCANASLSPHAIRNSNAASVPSASFLRKQSCYCPASRTTFIATRFRVAVICPIIPVPHCNRVFFYFVWFVFINHIFQFYYELCTYCNILDIYLS